MKCVYPIIFSFFLFSFSISHAQVYVDINASGLNNGTSWINAYTSLQTALTNTTNGQIWVANGTYRPTTCNPCLDADRLISFNLPPGVQLYGGFASGEVLLSQRDWTTNLCILSGDIGVQNDSTDNTFRIMSIENSLTTTRLDGFIIEEGNADGSSINGTYFSGGGIYIDANPGGTGHVRIHNCTIRNNFAGGGGGMTIDAVIGGIIEADIRNCLFENNRASTGNVSSTGGAILMLGNSGAQIRPTIEDCVFQNNYVGNDGAAISMTPSGATSFLETRISRCIFTNNESTDRGGAIWYRMIQGTSNVMINDCIFSNNIAGGQGGGVFARQSFAGVANDTLLNCIFSQNQSTGTSSNNDGEGGALFMRGSQDATRNHQVLNCVFDRNYATHRGGAVGTTSFFDTPSDTIGIINSYLVNCSFYGNTTDGEGGAVHANGTQGTNNMTFSNSIFWGDTAAVNGMEFFQVNSNLTVSYSDIAGGVPAGITDGGNNVATEPFYNDPDNGDLRIGGCSPLVNAGNNATVLSVQDPDPDGDIRIWAGTVDMGAYEVGIIYVDQDATGANNGTSWANAYTDLQDGINRAYGGDQVWVAEGTYKPDDCVVCTNTERLISFYLKSGTELYGGFDATETAISQRDWTTNFTVLSGDIGVPIDSTDNSFRVVTAENTTAKTVFDGVIVEEGNADGSSVNGTFFSGGGMYIDANPGGIGNLRIKNVTFRNNFAGGGGGVTIDAVIGGTIEAEFRDCLFEGNTASTGNVSSTGGAILMLGNSGATIKPTIIGCTFQNNFVGNDGAAISMTPSGATSLLATKIDSCIFLNNESTDRGAAIWYRMIQGTCEVKISNSTFQNNIAGGQGGGVFARQSFDGVANDTLLNCIFTLNSSTGTSSVNDGEGGAIFLRGSQTATRNHQILNCVFDRNFATHRGGAVGTTSFFDTPSDTVGIINSNFVNCTFYGNDTDGDGGAVHANAGQGTNNMTFSNSIFWNDSAGASDDEFSSNGASVSVAFSDVEGGIPAGITDGGNNLDTDPKFLDEINSDFHLEPCSPLIDIGDNSALFAIQDPDPDGNARTFNGTVDFGAYEFDGTPSVTAPAITTFNHTICPGESTSLTANSPSGGESGLWTVISGTGSFSPSPTSPNVIVSGLSNGTNIFGWDITNAFCDFDPAEVTITAEDLTPPDAVCQDITIQLDGSGNASITGADVDGGSTDDCGISSLTVFPNAFTNADLGPNNVTLTVFDIGGNDAICSATVTVEVVPIPMIICPANETATSSFGQCTGSVIVDPPLISNSTPTNAGVNLNGTSDFLNINSIAGFSSGSNARTFEAWIRTDGDGSMMTVFGYGDPGSATSYWAVKISAAGDLVLDIGTSSKTWTSNLDDGQWHHIAITNPAAGNLLSSTAYIDGAVATGSPGSTNLTTLNNFIVTIGHELSNTDRFAGDIDEVRFWDDQRTPLEITSNMNNELAGNEANLILYLNFNQGNPCGTNSSAQIVDLASNPTANNVFTVGLGNLNGNPPNPCGSNYTFGAPLGSFSVVNDFNGTDDASGTYPVGTTAVIWTYTDISGNTATCSHQVTVNQNPSPTITCPPDVTVGTDPGLCEAFVNVPLPTVNDACGSNVALNFDGIDDYINIGFITGFVTGSNARTVEAWVRRTDLGDNAIFFEYGSNSTSTSRWLIQIVATGRLELDLNGNTKMWTTNLNDGNWHHVAVVHNGGDLTNTDAYVDGNLLPVANPSSATPNTFNSTSVGVGTALPGLTDFFEGDLDEVRFWDDARTQSEIMANMNTQLTGSEANLILYFDFNQGDPCGNNTGNSPVVDVASTPTANNGTLTNFSNLAGTLPGPCISNYSLGAPLGSFGLTNDYNGTADASDIYPENSAGTTITWTYTSINGSVATCSMDVIVNDNEPPVAICQNITINLDNNTIVNVSPGQVNNGSTDNCGSATPLSLSQSIFDCNDVGDNTVILTVQDEVDNFSTCSAIVTIVDNTNPMVSCQNITVQLDASGNATITGSQVDNESMDNCGIQSLSVSPNTFDCINIGSNPVVLTVTDNSGNSATCSAAVTVEDNLPPIALCQDITVQLDGTGNTSITAGMINNGSSDNCNLQSSAVSQNTFNCADVGSNTIILTVTDDSGNSSTCTSTVTVEDNISPVAICQDITVQLDGTGNASITAGMINNGSSDNCNLQSASLSQNTFNCTDVGSNPITLTVTDDSGYSSTCSAMVFVEDNLPPIALCQDITIQLDGTGNASITPGQVDGGSSDNCSIQSSSVIPNTFDINDVGPNTVVLTISDENGNTNTCSAIVEVENNNLPNAVCQNITVQLDSVGQATITGVDIDGGSSAVGGIASLTATPDQFSCTELGQNNVTLTVTDNSGNTATCNAVVTVEDNIAPAAVCQNITVQLDGSGNSTIAASQVDGGSADNCGIQTLSVSPNTFDCTNVGQNNVTLTVTDNLGNSSTCSADVTVEDNIIPTAICQSITVQLDGSGNATVAASQVDGGSADNCGIQTLSVSPNTFDCTNVGQNNVTLTVTDNLGNSSTCSADVTVEDNIIPTAICQSITVQLDGSGNASIAASQVDGGSADNCGIQTLSVSPNTFDCNDIGTIQVTLTVTDNSGNISTCSANITVEDNIPPLAICQDLTAQLDASGQVNITWPDIDNGSSDNCGILVLSPSQTTFNCSEIGPNTVILSVTDLNGNVSTCSSQITVEDNLAPTAVCQNITVQLDGSGNASITAGQIDGGSTDNCAIQSLSVNPNTFDINDLGPNTVVLTVTDVNGNSSTCSAIVEVQNNNLPNAVCQNIAVQLDASGMITITGADIDGGSSAVGGIASLTATPDQFSCTELGQNNVTLTVTDNSGNTATCNAVVTVEDNMTPTAICQDITLQLDANGDAIFTASDIDGGSTDNCMLVSISTVPTSFSCNDIGINAAVLMVTDQSGNTGTCIAGVTVEDNLAPTVVCQNITVQLDGSGNASITAGQVDGGSTDNCSIQSLNVVPNTFDINDLGPNNVILTVTDVNGNSSTCSAIVEVQNNNLPNAVCQNIAVQLDASGMVTITGTDIDGGSSAVGGIASLTATPDQFSCTELGQNNVTLTVTDNSGNTATCNAVVTVEDNMTPTAICQDITLQLDANGDAIFTASDIDGGSTDNCMLVSISTVPTSFSCNDIGINAAVLMVTDQSGNTGTCIAGVTVEDNLAPTAVCQNITVQLDGSGNASITAGQIDGGSTDNCAIQSLSVNPNTFDINDLGPNTVVLTVTDVNGNSSTCSAIVEVQNNNLPNAVCQNIAVQLDASGMITITGSDIDGGSSAVGGIASLTATPDQFSCTELGQNNVTLTVTDNSGNTATCNAIVTVEDNMTPTAICQDITLQLDANGDAIFTASDIDGGSTDNCMLVSISTVPTSFSCNDIGINAAVLMVTDQSGNTGTCIAGVTVEDNLAPMVVCQNITVQLDGSGNASITAGQVDGGSTDNCSLQSLNVVPNTFDINDLGPNNVILTVTDVNGNSSTCSAIVEVQNNNLPNAVCQNIAVQLDASGMITITGADIDGGSSAVGGIASLTATPDQFSCTELGQNNVTLTVTDNSGNSATCNAIVTVQDNMAPTAICQDITVQIDGTGNATIAGADIDGGSTDNCGVQSTSLDISSFDCSNLGDNPVVLTVTDASGNTSTCSATVTVEDNLAPTAVCQNITVQLDGSGNASITAGQVDGGSTDNCAIQSLSVNPNTFDINDLGPNTVVLTVTDVNGNSSTCSAIVEVQNNNLPNAVCQNITVQLDPSGTATITGSDIDGGSSATGGIASLTATPDQFTCAEIGQNNVTLTVTDNAGNSATCNALVTVEDNIPPVALCQDITLALDANGNATADPMQIDNGSSDNCGIQSLSLDQTSFDCSHVGGNTVMLSVSGVNGNISMCSATITVEDNILPVALCQDITVQLDGSGIASITPGQVDNGSTDNCGIQNMTVNPDQFDINDVGPNTVILSVTDVNGNTSTCEAIVEVQNTGAPTAICQNITVQLDASGVAMITGSDIDNGSSVSSDTIFLFADPNTFDCGKIGVNDVSLCVMDESGQTASCVATVTVVDVTAPSCEAQDITLQIDANGMAVINAMDLAVPAGPLNFIDSGQMLGSDQTNEVALADFDDDGDLDALVVNQNGPPLNIPQNTIYFNDGAGSFTPSGVIFGPSLVRAVDVADIDGDNDLDIVMSSTNGEANSYLNDGAGNFSDGTFFIAAINTINLALGDLNGDCAPDVFVGNGGSSPNTVKLNNGDGTFTDTGQMLGAGISWTVELGDVDGDGDLDAVVANTNSPDKIWINDGNGNFTDSGQSLYSGQSTGMRLGDLDGDNDLDYFITTNNSTQPSLAYLNDGAGNFTGTGQNIGLSNGFDVELRDFDNDGDLDAFVANSNQPDSIWVNDGNAMFTALATALPVTPVFGTASGDVDGDGDIDIFEGMINPGLENSIFLNTISGSGTLDNCTAFDDLSFEADPPSFDCTHLGTIQTVNLIVTDASGNSSTCSANVTIEGANVLPPSCITQDITIQLDGNGMASITEDQVDNGSTGVCQPLSFDTDITDFDITDVGPNTVVLTVTDVVGNMSTCTAIVTVEDNNTMPMAVCQNVTVQLDGSGSANIIPADVDGGSSASAGIQSMSVSPDQFDCTNIGQNTVVLTVTDNNGMTATCSAIVTVEDNIPPVALCQDITLQLDASGNATADPTQIDNGSSDNCGIQSMDLSQTAFDCSHVGDNPVTLTVSGVNGNMTMCSATISIEDNIPPIALCQDITVQLDGNGMASITPGQVDGGSTDNCGIQNMSVSPDQFDINDVGPNTVILTVTDVNGNFSTCSSIVEVQNTGAPTAICQNITVQLDASGVAMITGSDIDNGSSVSSDTIFLFANPNTFDCGSIGVNDVSLCVMDESGQTASCMATVTVVDVTAPSCEAQDITIQIDANGMAVINAMDLAVPAGPLNFIDSGQMLGSDQTNEVALADFDDDGDLDALVVNQNGPPLNIPQNTIYFNDGAGSFTPSGVIFGPSLVRAVDVADIDGDNDLDIVMSSTNGEANSYLNDGAGNFSDGTFFIAAINTINLALGDLNGDCAPDVFVGNGGSSPNTVKLNNGDGTFTDTGQMLGAGISWTVELGDVDGDGDLDAVVANTNSPDKIWINDGNGNFTDSGQSLYSGQSTGMRLGDLDGDNDLDYFITTNNSTQPSLAYLNDGAGNFTGTGQNIGLSNGFDVELRDFDNDGDLDAFVANSNQPDSIWVNDGNAMFTALATALPVTPVFGTASGDVDGDGDIDIFEGMINPGLENSIFLNTISGSGTLDNCTAFDDLSFEADPPSFDCTHLGTIQTVNLIVTDASGNSSTCSANVTIEGANVLPPSCITQDITIQLDGNGMASITEDQVDNGSTGVCQPLSFDTDITDFDITDVGPNTVVLTVTDVVGNMSTCTAIVTVEDNNTMPMAVCQNVTVQLDGSGSANIIPADVDGGSSASAGIQSMSVSPDQFDCTNIGQNTVVLTVTDNNGMTATCSAIVTVEDNIPPVALCQDITLQLNASGNATADPTQIDNGSSDNCGIQSMDLSQTAFDCSHVGDNPVTLTVSGVNGNMTMCSATISIEDNIPPIALCQDITVQLDGNGMASITPGQVDGGSTDNCGIQNMSVSPDQFDINDVGPNTVILTVTDVNGNSSTCSSIVEVQNTGAPNAVCQNITVQLSTGGYADILPADVDGGSTASAGIQSMIVSPNQFDCTNIGLNAVVLTVTDNNGMTATCTANVSVEDILPPLAFCQDITLQLDANGNATADPSQVNSNSSDNCGILSMSLNQTAFDCSHAGDNSVILTIFDVNGNMSECSATITIQENQTPTAICQDITLQLDGNGNANLDPSSLDNGSFDNCGQVSFSADITQFDCSHVGQNNLVLLTVSDDSGNISTCQSQVTVEDNSTPLIDCPMDIVSNSCNSMVQVPMPNITSVCGMIALSNDYNGGPDASDIYPVGTTTVIWSVTDLSGNTATCSMDVTVNNTLNVTATSTSVTCFGDQDGTATASPSGGVGPFSFLWSDPSNQITQTATGLSGGSFSVTVTDSQGCSDVTSVSVPEAPALILQGTSMSAVCGQSGGSASVNVSGGTGNYTYQWSNVNTTSSATGLLPGTYSVTVSDDAGCTQSEDFEIDQQGSLQANVMTTEVSCFGESDGSAEITNSGSFVYEWSTGETTSSISGLPAGNYSYSITGELAGCFDSGSIEINQPPPTMSDIMVFNSSCGDSFGSAAALVSGGVSPYTYLWNTGDITPSINNLPTGTYSITITDANGCEETNSAFVSSEANGPILSTTQVNVSCFGSNDGSIDLTITNGEAPFNISWSDGINTEDRMGLSPGTYSVLVSDANGCFAATSVVISEAGSLTLDMDSTPSSGSDGTAFVNVLGGVTPFTFQWNNGGSGPIISDLAPGIYTVFVTDANGCTGSGQVEVPLFVSTSEIDGLAHFEVYPNPSAGRVTVDIGFDRNREFTLSVYNVIGQKVYESNHQSGSFNDQIDLTRYRSGMFFLRLETDSGSAVRPLVILD